MTQSMERRLCTRTPFNTNVIIIGNFEDIKLEVDLSNISIVGMYVQTDQNLPEKTKCTIEIIITGKNSRLVLDSIQAVVVRNDTAGIALSFTSNMEWFVLFKIYTHYGNPTPGSLLKEAENRRLGPTDRRAGPVDRRLTINDRRKKEDPVRA